MSFTIRTRGARGRMIAEYECPECGRFEMLVMRDENGDPPNTENCPPCSYRSPLVISAPLGKVKLVEAHRGKSDAHLPHQLDTRPLADGMPYNEWAAKVDKKAFDEQRAKLRKRVL